jgi:nitrilase
VADSLRKRRRGQEKIQPLRLAVWPGGLHNTQGITRFIAREGRSYVMSVSGLMRAPDIPAGTPHRERILAGCPETPANGGSCLAGRDGGWVVKPVVDREALVQATIEHQRVREERQNFDPAGHYARPDVTQLTVTRERQSSVRFKGLPAQEPA